MPTILVVDDFRDWVLALRTFLEGEGYEVLEAYDGMQALEVLESTNPDLIILDVMMPKMDGWTCLQKIEESGRGIPVMMLTALNDPMNVRLGIDLGVTWYYTKPICDFPDFAFVIQRILGGADEVAAPDDW